MTSAAMTSAAMTSGRTTGSGEVDGAHRTGGTTATGDGAGIRR